MLTACFFTLLHLLFLLIRIAMKLRLSIPLVYLVLMLTVFQPWYRTHTALADGIFLVMLGCTVLSWIITCVHFNVVTKHTISSNIYNTTCRCSCGKIICKR